MFNAERLKEIKSAIVEHGIRGIWLTPGLRSS